MRAGALDECAEGFPETGMLVVVTSTYNGRAPDNAQKLEAAILQGRLANKRAPELRYALLGCGNTQWRETYQAFPKLIDATLQQSGATACRAAR